MDHISAKVVRLRAPEFTDPELLRRNRCATASPVLAEAQQALNRIAGYLSYRDFDTTHAGLLAGDVAKLIGAAQTLRTIARGSVVVEAEQQPEPEGAA